MIAGVGGVAPINVIGGIGAPGGIRAPSYGREAELDVIRHHTCEPPPEMKLAWRIEGVRTSEILARGKMFDFPLV